MNIRSKIGKKGWDIGVSIEHGELDASDPKGCHSFSPLTKAERLVWELAYEEGMRRGIKQVRDDVKESLGLK